MEQELIKGNVERLVEHEDFSVALCEVFGQEQASDDDFELDKVVAGYNGESEDYRRGVNDVLCGVCGWTLPTLVEKARKAMER